MAGPSLDTTGPSDRRFESRPGAKCHCPKVVNDLPSLLISCRQQPFGALDESILPSGSNVRIYLRPLLLHSSGRYADCCTYPYGYRNYNADWYTCPYGYRNYNADC